MDLVIQLWEAMMRLNQLERLSDIKQFVEDSVHCYNYSAI